MSIFSRSDEDLLVDEGRMFGAGDRYERRKAALERVREIHSGFVSGLFERDEEVLEMLRELKERDL